MSPPPTTTTFPLTPPFSPTTAFTHPLTRVQTLDLDAPTPHQGLYDSSDEEDSSSDLDEDENPESAMHQHELMMKHEEAEWKEKGIGGKGKLRVVIVTGEFKQKQGREG